VLVDNGQIIWNPKDYQIQALAGVKRELYIKPLPDTLEAFPEASKTFNFHAYLYNAHFRFAAVTDFNYDPDRGYRVEFTAYDDGVFNFQVVGLWAYGSNDIDQSPPILISSHITFQYIECNEIRSQIYGSPFTVVVSNPGGVPPKKFGDHKCTGGEEPGRWIDIPLNKPCEPPYCTGSRQKSKVTVNWDGVHQSLTWVPYNCYLHFYDPEDIQYCAEKKNIKWIHVLGDSQVREIPAIIMTMYGIADSGKFQHSDQYAGKLRVTFESYEPSLMFSKFQPRKFQPDQCFLDHFNVFGNTSRRAREPGCENAIETFTDPNHLIEVTRPDVWLFNPAMAYVTWRLSFKQWQQWVEDFVDYAKTVPQTHPFSPEYQGKPMQKIWYSPPQLFGQAHAGSDEISSYRMKQFNDFALPRLRQIGFTVMDPLLSSATRPVQSWDGLHYARGGATEWHGSYASQNTQSVLNMIFGDCAGEHPNSVSL